MPEKVKSSWADAIETEGTTKKPLPPSTEVINGDTKIVTDYKFNEEDKKVKVGDIQDIPVKNSTVGQGPVKGHVLGTIMCSAPPWP